MAHVHILLAEELHSTGHYLAVAAQTSGFTVSLNTSNRILPELTSDDLLLYVDPGCARFPLDVDRLGCVKAAYLSDVHRDLNSRIALAPLFDVLFVAQRDYVNEFRRRGYVNTWWLPLACDPKVH